MPATEFILQQECLGEQEVQHRGGKQNKADGLFVAEDYFSEAVNGSLRVNIGGMFPVKAKNQHKTGGNTRHSGEQVPQDGHSPHGGKQLKNADYSRQNTDNQAKTIAYKGEFPAVFGRIAFPHIPKDKEKTNQPVKHYRQKIELYHCSGIVSENAGLVKHPFIAQDEIKSNLTIPYSLPIGASQLLTLVLF
jgi:hypothetical protein